MLWKKILITSFSVILFTQAHSATLNFVGAGSYLSGSGTAANMTAGTSVLISSVGTDDFGNNFDAILTLNSKGGTGALDASQTGAFIHANGRADTWGSFTLSFIVAGSSTPGNLTGSAIGLTGVSSFIAKDIDSSNTNANNSDVFGYFTNGLETSITRGGALENNGFVHSSGQPTTGVDYSRLDPSAGGNLTNFNGEGFVNETATTHWATYNYNNATINSFDFVWGTTSTATNGSHNSGNRGMLGELNFTGVAPVPEPTSFALLSLTGICALLRRKR